jgi:hypothetical protein
MKYIKNIFLLAFVYLTLQGCGIYSFTGIALHPDDKTITIKYFPNRAELVNANLSQKFTEALKNRFITQTNLQFVPINGDLQFEGEIVGYETKPVSVTEQGTANNNRLTIKVRVKYESVNNAKFNFGNTFSRYADYESTKMLTDVEDALVEQIVEELIDDIFNKSVVNW